MLRVIKIKKEKYDSLSIEDKQAPFSLFLCENEKLSKCSIYYCGKCYGEDVDSENINSKIESVQNQINSFQIANNYDILQILNS